MRPICLYDHREPSIVAGCQSGDECSTVWLVCTFSLKTTTVRPSWLAKANQERSSTDPMDTRPNPKGRIKRYEPIEQILLNRYTPSAHSSSDEPPFRRSHPENMLLPRTFIHPHHPITRASLAFRHQQAFSYRQKLRLQVSVPPCLLAKRIVPQNNAVFVMMVLDFFLNGTYDGLMALEFAVNSHKVRVFVLA
ncbi:hypothetical protein STAS_11292 [Striga asiatica]|uniref:Uncharacterized protein n=1 Tax=Striga asiatica TaxID=4170 RepID=A0A5A7PQU1_STRAF|nr:hypothetical protein STAS_11292 [Striga asiatica]